MITEELIHKLFPRNARAELMAPYWVTYAPAAGLDTPLRLAMYFAQAAHESGNLRFMEENLNYSAQALANTWPTRYSATTAKPYVPNDLAKSIARDPVQIANYTYANRMGNGGPETGDGFKYRGRGVFQLTGKDAYAAYSADTYNDNRCVINPSLVAYAEDAVRSSLWYWNSRTLNDSADERDLKTNTRKINGGLIGLDDREKYYNKFCNLLGI
jgi:putative chitinase